jgi:hypothetical protein
MLIVALVMAVIGLAALVTAVVTSNEVIAWVCIGASVIGIVLLIVDALRERQRRDAEAEGADENEAGSDHPTEVFDAEYPDEPRADTTAHEASEDSGDTGRRPG